MTKLLYYKNFVKTKQDFERRDLAAGGNGLIVISGATLYFTHNANMWITRTIVSNNNTIRISLANCKTESLAVNFNVQEKKMSSFR